MTPKEDIDVIIQWIIDEACDGRIAIPNGEVFRELHKMNCKNFAGGECLKGGRCDGNCQRMKNYDKKFLNKEDNERNSN